ncbi:MAG: hypothetical protein K2R98_18710 [Gemmataceae bacterium]|nr:hypothetical protein [Gemmataceae bacterium]
MFEDLDRLRASEPLRQLLKRYVEVADVQAWQDRVMAMDGLKPRDLVDLHGQLLAFDWLEQNTGVVTAGSPGTVAGCYKATAAGRRALQAALDVPVEEEIPAEAA